MFLEFLSKTEVSEPQEIFSYDDDLQNLEAFQGDSLIISTAQELNNLKDSLN